MILAVAGPSGVGKTKVLEIGNERCSYERPVAWTTRSPRPGEQEGRHYHFVQRSEFHQRVLQGLFIDWDYTIGSYYGYDVDVERFVEGGAAILAVTARVAIRLATRFPHVCSLFLDGHDERLQERVDERGVDDSERALRELHRAEEREHAPLFAERLSDADALTNEEIETLLTQLRKRYAEA